METKPINLLILIRGVAGSGKTSLAKKLLDIEPGRFDHFEADMFYTDEKGNYHFNIDQLGNAHQWCSRATEGRMKVDEDIIVSNTFTTPWEMELYFKLATIYNYEVLIHDMTTRYRSIHNVPESVLERQVKTFVPKDKVISDCKIENVNWSKRTIKDLIKEMQDV